MLTQAAEGVWVHESVFVQTNTIVVRGDGGVLLVDPGLTRAELDCLAGDLAELGQPVVAGFSTHPHWDHVLWDARFGDVPRYGTARCAAAMEEELSHAGAKDDIADHLLETEIAGQVPLDLLGLVTGLPPGATRIPWDGPAVRIVEHQAHAPGHAALLIEDRGVLIAGDMLSDVLIPMLESGGVADYLAALDLIEDVAGQAGVVIPGHGSVGGPGQARERIDLDRAYVLALRDGRAPADPRIGPSAKPGWEWVGDVHEGQFRQF
ncbi:MBL fold metallo-hydrolase [Herbidospora daliensis]|uniref:MBL fold metallo-hydrolase n=1 Tax=Herbidospora daliensis TaxID=295585 RepID=UPI0007826008|nr:MBL fold metallo-hydrolase [Herbidospora daliensis]